MNHWKRKAGILLFVISLLFTMVGGQIHVQAKQRTIRVGWPTQPGFSMTDQENHYSGYTYDYLQEISQYTGWWYEFVEVEGDVETQLTTLLNMLENGEIDLMGAMRQNEATIDRFDFPSEEYGYSYQVLAILNDNEEIDEYNYTKKKDVKVGAISNAESSINKLAQFADVNQLSYQLVLCDDGADLFQKLRTGEVDAILSRDVSLENDMSPIVKFGGDPFYFATTKGNNEINTELNQALLDLQEAYPTLENDLYHTYFGSKATFKLTSQEKAFIKEHPVLTVVYLDDIAPLSYQKDGECVGAAIDVMNEIAKMSGLSIQYIQAHSFADYRAVAKTGDFDVLLTYPYQYSSGKQLNLTLSKPYLEIPLTFVTRNGMSPQNLESKVEAVIDGFGFHTHKGEGIYNVSTVKDALAAVNGGSADYFYGIGAMVSYYTTQFKYENLQLIYGVEESYGKLCFGVNGKESSTLTAILNKALHAISPQDLESSLYSHSYQNADMSIEDIFYRYRNEITFFILLFLVVLIFAIYRYYAQQLKMKDQIELENQRYKMLSEISGEMIFEYDYKKDCLRINKTVPGNQRIIEHYYEDTKQKQKNQLDKTLIPLIDQPQKQCEMMLLHDHGLPRWHRIIARVIYDKNHHPLMMIGRFRDVHEEVMEREKLKQDAHIDKLTGLYNADSIREIAGKMVKEVQPNKGVLMIIDMDHFKEINDRYGHYQGDRVLTQVGDALNRVFSPYGVVGRLGGDEFLAFLQEPGDDTSIQLLADQLFDLLQQLPIAKKLNCIIALSIGYVYVEESRDFYQLYKCADQALYQVKENGRNDICKYQKEQK